MQEIHDYSLSQTTLDDVFIHFASRQSEEERSPDERRRGSEGHSGPLPDVVAHSGGVGSSTPLDIYII